MEKTQKFGSAVRTLGNRRAGVALAARHRHSGSPPMGPRLPVRGRFNLPTLSSVTWSTRYS